MHGYELKKRLADVFGLSTAVSFGSLYPALARLEVAGAVLVVVPPKAPAPTANQAVIDRRASRRRKVYGITPLGAKVFEDLLAQHSGEDERSFNLRLAFARYLPPEGRLGLLEQRRAVLGDRLAQLADRARARRDDRYIACALPAAAGRAIERCFLAGPVDTRRAGGRGALRAGAQNK